MSSSNSQSRQPPPPESPPNLAAYAIAREGVLEVETPEGAEPVVRLTVSSETPCLVMRYWDGQNQAVYEILDHAESSINRTYIADGLPIKDGHDGDQIALIPQPAVVAGKLGGAAVWSATERAKALQSDCIRKVRRNVSVEGQADPHSYRQEGEQDGRPVVRAMAWTPFAAALVSTRPPADPTVGVARQVQTPVEAPNILTRKDTPMAEETPKPVTLTADDASAIFTMARQHNVAPEYTAEVLKRAISPAAFGMEILTGKAAKVDPKPVAAAHVSEVVPAQELKRYSLYRAVQSLVDGKNCFEREVSDAIAQAMGRPAQGIYMPNEIARVASGTMSVADAYGSAGLVATERYALVEMLRAALCLTKLGITYITGAVGDVEIPKQTGGATTYWVARDGSITASNAAIGLLKATPKTIGARTLIGRSMLKQASISAEAFTQRDLANALAGGIETKAFAGKGGNELTGLKLATDLNAATITTPGSATWPNLLTFEAMIRADNAGELGAKKWAMPSDVLFNLKGLQKGTSLGFMVDNMNGVDYIDGKPVIEANNAPAKSAWFGVWSELLMILWGATDISVDPYSASSSGAVYITALQDVDTIVRNGKAFSYNGAVIS